MTCTGAPLNIAAVGYGYWGPNIVRNIVERPELELSVLCERDRSRAESFSRRYPGIPTCESFNELLVDPAIDAVAIATPPRTHFSLVAKALEARKHVLVEKPLAATVREATELVALAERNGLVLMPGHTFLYSPPVNKVRELVNSGELGEIYFVTSSRMNLGLYQPDGVLCDLAPHDLSILLYWLDQPVSLVAASGRTVYQKGVPETAFLTLCFDEGCTANVQLSWLAPRKVRQMVVVGSKRMVQYDDTSSDDTVRVYDRGFDFGQPANFGEYQLTYRSGDMIAPRIHAAEPLSLELEDFSSAVATGRPPRSNAQLGLEIVRVLEAAHASLEHQGQPVLIERDGRQPPVSEAAARAGNGNGHFPHGGRNGSDRQVQLTGTNGNGNGGGNGYPANNGHIDDVAEMPAARGTAAD
jgi:predicted dehydrogenase